MSFGRLTTSAFSGVVDTTFALASLNFDFSLIKVEAPQEYREFGLQLSAQRSRDAEQGLSHITARKLGALFVDIIPPCPNLIAAYGLRVSEIAKSSFNPRGSWTDGIFAEHVGADGTNIWAAATSGSTAIALHLLACMLARTWTAPKAISIWVELVLKRKAALLGPDSMCISPLTAQISISRDQLAKWDSSARAWLQTADAAKLTCQKQLMLIISNISVPVNDKPELYESVVLAWKTAMTAVEGLLSGVSQSVQTGAPLLGLCSWHLYPDMIVLGKENKVVKQNDPLIPSGTIATLGLQNRKVRCSETDGVFWSLPLAHLRHYGDPVMATGSVEMESGLTLNQLMQVALGSFLGQWVRTYEEFEGASRILILISDYLPEPFKSTSNWLDPLARAATAYLNSKGQERIEHTRLLKSGRRRYPNFLAEKRHWIRPFLGLTLATNLLGLSADLESRIAMLRYTANGYENSGEKMIIVYYPRRHRFDDHLECASASTLPVDCSDRGKKRSREGIQSSNKCHLRWVETCDYDSTSQIRDLGEAAVELPLGSLWTSCTQAHKFSWKHAPSPYGPVIDWRNGGAPHNIVTHFDLVLGDPSVAALYAARPSDQSTPSVTNSVAASVVEKAFHDGRISPSKLVTYLIGLEVQEMKDAKRPATASDSCSPTIRSARALYLLSEVYRYLKDARLALKAADTPLYQSKWVRNYMRRFVGIVQGAQGLPFHSLTYAQTFACIVSFESGYIDISPGSLKHVMAMSTGSSIYIAGSLLSDPAQSYKDGKVKRVVGNVGRAGMAMLIAPKSPGERVLDPNTWNQVNHDDFDGKAEDSFQNTTLHISFTDWEMSIDVGDRGARDREVFFLEAPISIHHRGKWVADVDILKALTSPMLKLLSLPVCNEHNGNSWADANKGAGVQRIIAIDSWEEFLDTPLEDAVVRAHRNWQARLAATALSLQRGHPTFVLSESFCWTCFRAGKSRSKTYVQLLNRRIREKYLRAEREVQKQKEMAERLRIGGSAANNPVILDDDEDIQPKNENDEKSDGLAEDHDNCDDQEDCDDDNDAEVIDDAEDEDNPGEILKALEDDEDDEDENENDEGFSPHWAEPKLGEIVDVDEIIVVDLESGLNPNNNSVGDQFFEAHEDIPSAPKLIYIM